MERCVYEVAKRISDIFDKKIPKFVNKQEVTQLLQSDNYEDMKKANLITLVVNLYGYKISHAKKLKHAELVKILVNKNINSEIKDDNIKINDKHKIIKVEYNEPNIRCNGENKSKLLKTNSELYNHLMKLKEILNDNTETIDDFIKRVNILEGREIDIKNPENYDIIGRAIVLLLGDLEGYNKDAKITIAFIDNDKIQDAMKCLLANI